MQFRGGDKAILLQVMSVTFHDDVFSGLNLGFTTRATGGEVREESLSVFSNGDVTSSYVGEASA